MNNNLSLDHKSLKNKMTFKELFKKVYPYLSKNFNHVWPVLLAVFTFTLLGRLLPQVFKYAIDEGISQSNLSIVYTCASIYLALELSRALAAFLQRYMIQRLGNKVLFHIREDLISHVQCLPLRFFDQNASGRIVTRLTNDCNNLKSLFTEGFTDVFINSFEMLTILFAMLWVSVPLTLVTIAIAPLILWLSLKVSHHLRFHFSEAKRKISLINATTAESINGMKVLQLYQQIPHSLKLFELDSASYRQSQLKTVQLFALLWPLISFFNIATIAVSILLGAYFVEQGNLKIGALSAFILYVQGFFRPIRIILERYNQFQDSITSAERIFNLMDIPTEENTKPQDPTPIQLEGSIEFKNLYFKYEDQGDWVLKNINFSIQPGESIALVGRTGCGKSTLISLLQNLYSVQQGDLLIDHKPIQSYNRSSLRNRIGVVLQNNFIFRGTISSNVTLDNLNISNEKLEKALHMANCNTLIKNRGEGYEAEVKAEGANLSTGEKQLIAMARALAFDPDILVLDEATSNIDSQTEALIQKSIEMATQNRTSIIIAHRLSTVKKCDRIVVLDRGEIIESGTHDELLSHRGLYYELIQSSKDTLE